jgi:TolA-binding protein
MAWCFYNQKKFGDSIRAFQEVIEQSRSSEGQQGSLNLTADALDDLVLAYAEARKPEEAKRYFATVGGDKYYYKMLQKLSDIYYSTGRHADANNVYTELLEIDPNNINAPDYKKNMIEGYRVMNKPTEMRRTLEEYVLAFNAKSEWAQVNRNKPDQVQDAVDAGEFAMRKAAKEAHFFAQKVRKRSDYQAAANMYGLYLKYFGDTEQGYEMKFFYAEALFQVGEYKTALTWYKNVADYGKTKKYYADATFGGIVAFMSDRGKQDKKAPEKVKGKLEPVSLEDFEREYLELVDRFANDLPKDSRSGDLVYQAGYLCYDKNQFECSTKRFNWVIQHKPKSEKAIFAAHLILDTYNLQDRYTELAQTAKRFLNNPELGDSKFKAEMREILSKSRFKALEVLESQGKHKEAALGYAQLGAAEKGLGVADKAYYNAGVNFVKANEPALALKYYGLVASEYPNSSLAPSSILYVANYHNQRLHVREAAAAYQRYAKIAPKAEDAPNASYDAAVLLEAAQQYGDAADAYAAYAAAYRHKDDAPTAYRKSCEMILKRKNVAQAVKCYGSTRNAFPQAGLDHIYSEGAILDIFEERRDAANIKRQSQRIVSGYANSASKLPPDAKAIVARAHLHLTSEDLARFNAIQFNTTNGAELARRIKLKLGAINKLEQQTTDILKYGVGEAGIPALYQLGNGYENFARALKGAPKPPKLTPQQVELYEAELAKIAAPIEAKGLGHYEKAYQVSQNLSVYSDWTKRVYARLADLNPSAYPSRFDEEMQAVHISEFLTRPQ